MRPQPPQRVLVLCCPELCRPETDGREGRSREARGPAGRGGEGRGRSAAAPDRGAARVFERVIAVLAGFCPAVEAVEPGVCAFGARGPARYFGGETVLAGKIIAAVADVGVEGRIGVADGLFAALLAARGRRPVTDSLVTGGPSSGHPSSGHPSTGHPSSGHPSTGHPSSGRLVTVVPPGGTAEFLAPQPVSVLVDQDLAGLLHRLGLRTLGDLAALSAADVASRFGDAGEAAHRLAGGLGSRPLAVRPPDEDLSAAQEFDPPESRSEPVVFAAKALAERMLSGLTARGLTCVRVQVVARWADGIQSSRRWRHDGVLSAVQVADRVRWQLDGGRETADGDPERPGADTADAAGGGIVLLRLVPDQVVRATGRQLALWGETAVSDRVARAAMRVQAMLGPEAVLRPVTGGGRDAGEQVTHVPFGEKGEPRLAGGRPWPGRIMGPAPSVVYPEALEAWVTDDAGQAVTVTGRCVVSAQPAALAVGRDPPRPVTGWAGPWPLAERWWDPAAARRRARFQLETDDGRAWLVAVQDGRWQIEAGYW
jgi:protein ImuB